MEGLEPCPFCGNESVDMWDCGDFESPLCLECGATFAEGITGKNTDAQVEAWNTRTPPDKGSTA